MDDKIRKRAPGGGRKPLHDEGKGYRVSACVPAPLVVKLDQAAEHFQASRSRIVTEAIRQWLARFKKQMKE